MTTQQFGEQNKDTEKIVSLNYQTGIYDCNITAYPKGITNPHFVEFKSSSVVNLEKGKRNAR
jgi:hypothetical protein